MKIVDTEGAELLIRNDEIVMTHPDSQITPTRLSFTIGTAVIAVIIIWIFLLAIFRRRAALRKAAMAEWRPAEIESGSGSPLHSLAVVDSGVIELQQLRDNLVGLNDVLRRIDRQGEEIRSLLSHLASSEKKPGSGWGTVFLGLAGEAASTYLTKKDLSAIQDRIEQLDSRIKTGLEELNESVTELRKSPSKKGKQQ
jgi:hypothetical protein